MSPATYINTSNENSHQFMKRQSKPFDFMFINITLPEIGAFMKINIDLILERCQKRFKSRFCDLKRYLRENQIKLLNVCPK